MRLRIVKSFFSFVPDRFWIDLERVSGLHLSIDYTRSGCYMNDCALRSFEDPIDFDWNGPRFTVHSVTRTLAFTLIKWQVAFNWTSNNGRST